MKSKDRSTRLYNSCVSSSSHLAALTGMDSIVVAGGTVSTHSTLQAERWGGRWELLLARWQPINNRRWAWSWGQGIYKTRHVQYVNKQIDQFPFVMYVHLKGATTLTANKKFIGGKLELRNPQRCKGGDQVHLAAVQHVVKGTLSDLPNQSSLFELHYRSSLLNIQPDRT